MDRSWQIDEMDYAGTDHLDPEYVSAYDRKQGNPDPVEDVEIFAAHGLGLASSVVDFGAGTGQFALAASRRFGNITAVDVAPPMIGRLRERAAAEHLANVQCVQAGFLSFQNGGTLFDGAFSRNALHHLPDFWKAIALQRVADLLRPGGILRVRDLIYDFAPSAVESNIERWLEGAAADPTLGYTRSDFATHIRTEHSTFRWLFEPMLETAGFEILSAEFERAVYGAYTCIKR